MAQSARRKIKRGKLRMVWNESFKRMDFFRRTAAGNFILSTSTGRDLSQGPGYRPEQLDALANR